MHMYVCIYVCVCIHIEHKIRSKPANAWASTGMCEEVSALAVELKHFKALAKPNSITQKHTSDCLSVSGLVGWGERASWSRCFSCACRSLKKKKGAEWALLLADIYIYIYIYIYIIYTHMCVYIMYVHTYIHKYIRTYTLIYVYNIYFEAYHSMN